MTSPEMSDVGRRVSIRVLDSDGRTRDLVGILTSCTTVRRRDGSDAEFDPLAITHWRLVPDRPLRAGTGAPQNVRVRELESAAAATWPAEVSVMSGGWLLRASGGVTQRANSALPLGEPPGTLEQALARVVEFARAEGIVPAVQVPLPTFGGLDEFLEGQGWAVASENHVLVHDTSALAASDPGPVTGHERAIRHEDEPSDDWRSVQGPDDAAAIMRRWPADYVSVWVEGSPVGAGRIAFADEWGIVSRVHVAAGHRGKGIGSTVLRALAATAQDARITRLALQVSADNAEALGLYARLGFRPHHRYRHRRLAEPGKGAS